MKKFLKVLLSLLLVFSVSNISFGLPNRTIVNSHFYTLAMNNGLSAGIVNPSNILRRQGWQQAAALIFQKPR